MRITTPILLASLRTCEPSAPPPPNDHDDGAVWVPGPHALEERICFALAERCDVTCDAATFAALEALDGPIEAAVLRELDGCFPEQACGDFRPCVDRWVAARR